MVPSFDCEVPQQGGRPETAKLNWRNWANLLAYIANITITYLSLTGIFGETNTNLSKKYQTVVTPAGWAFSIWGPIFIWEGVFAVAQMLPKHRSSPVAQLVTPWWSAACAFQVAWSAVFGAEFLLAACVCMLGILGSLLGLLLTADRARAPLSLSEYWLLRAPFSLHAGWVIAASAVNASVLADSWMCSAGTLLALAIVSLAVILAVVVLFVVASPKPDAIISFVAAWSLGAIHAELGSATHLLDPSRFNFFAWDEVSLAGLRGAALVLSLASLGLGLLAAGLRTCSSQDRKPPAAATAVEENPSTPLAA
eukprot:CAMPEP_0115058076 /NCGR_PEP_ID=MMETSP0227-20121206/6137_1 /TAXON_ID=89957 /ORGANISM="Polarella glacialis, Strain CCMP 1383" /LENGTH=309 /DNA_ID=CAMNT_0002442999 /DNA_START=104 /DNA_END=1033 /DNA_ORIENTATION=-